MEDVGKVISLCRVGVEGIRVPIVGPRAGSEEVIARVDGVGVVVKGEGVVEELVVVVEEVRFGVSVVSVTGGVVGIDVW